MPVHAKTSSGRRQKKRKKTDRRQGAVRWYGKEQGQGRSEVVRLPCWMLRAGLDKKETGEGEKRRIFPYLLRYHRKKEGRRRQWLEDSNKTSHVGFSCPLRRLRDTKGGLPSFLLSQSLHEQRKGGGQRSQQKAACPRLLCRERPAPTSHPIDT